MSTAASSKRKDAEPLDDRASARIAWKAASGIAIPDETIARLDPDWQECVLVVSHEGPDGFEGWLDRIRRVTPDRAVPIELALAEAKLEPTDDQDDDAGPSADPRGRAIDFGIIGSGEFASAVYRLVFLIRGFLVEGQPCVVGGPRKALKTSLLVEMAVCLSAALRFLDQFDIAQRRRVLFLSGESGQATLQETARRICKARGIGLAELDGWLFWGFSLPKLGDPRHIDALAEFVRANRIEVVIIDPLYLCLLSGGGPGAKRLDPANLFDVGPLLAAVTEAILGAGATPILAHHLRKNRDNPDAPPELEDLAFAGIQEFARQWVLIGRRTPYEPGTGQHQLWLSVGGSAGHSGSWALDVSEGVVDEHFNGRTWETTLSRASDARQEARQQAAEASMARKATQDQAKQEAAQRKRDEDARFALGRLKAMADAAGRPGHTTARAWRDAMGWNSARFGPVQEHLLAMGKIAPTDVAIHAGTSSRTVPGFCLSEHFGHAGANRDEPGRTGTPGKSPGSTPGPGRTGTVGGFPPLKGGNPGSPGSESRSQEGVRDDRTGTPGKSPGSNPPFQAGGAARKGGA